MVLEAPRGLAIGSCAWSPDGCLLYGAEAFRETRSGTAKLSTGPLFLHVWRVDSGEHMHGWPAHDGEIVRCARSTNGASLATLDQGGELKTWNCVSGELHATARLDRLFPGQAVCDYSPDGSKLLVASKAGLFILHAADLRPSSTLAFAYCACWSGDGSSVFAWVNGEEGPELRVFHLRSEHVTFATIARVDALSWTPTRMVASGSGCHIVSGGVAGSLHVASRDSGESRLLALGSRGACLGLALVAEDRLALAGFATGFVLADIASAAVLAESIGPLSDLSKAPDDSSVACVRTSPSAIELHPLENLLRPTPAGVVQRTAPPTRPLRPRGTIACPDLRQEIAVRDDGEVDLVDLPSTVRVRRLGRIERGGRFPDAESVSVLHAYSPSGDELLCASTREIVSTESGAVLRTLADIDARGEARCGAFSPCGRMVVVAGGHDPRGKFRHLAPVGWVATWRVRGGEVAARFTKHRDVVIFCVFSADGSRVLSGDAAGALRVWDPLTAREIASFESRTRADEFELLPGNVVRMRLGGISLSRSLTLVGRDEGPAVLTVVRRFLPENCDWDERWSCRCVLCGEWWEPELGLVEALAAGAAAPSATCGSCTRPVVFNRTLVDNRRCPDGGAAPAAPGPARSR